MPKYREIVTLPSLKVNGKEYYKNQYVRDVVITEQEAKFNNKHPGLTGCRYELIDDAKDERNELFAEAKELELKVPKNISTEKLKIRINEAKELIKE